jgi:hypothetical protein
MNIIQQQEALKDLSDQQIAKQMQQPSGEMPLYLVSSEAKRRADLRDRYKTEASGPPPTTTVQEDLLRSVMSSEMAPSGIAQNIPQPPPTQAAQSAPQMPPQMPPQQQGIMQGAPSMPPQGLPGNTGAPRGFAMGGAVRGFQAGGGMSAVLNNPNISPFQKRQLHALQLRNARNSTAAAGLGGAAPTPATSQVRQSVVGSPTTSPTYTGSANTGPLPWVRQFQSAPVTQVADQSPPIFDPDRVSRVAEAEASINAGAPGMSYMDPVNEDMPGMSFMNRGDLGGISAASGGAQTTPQSGIMNGAPGQGDALNKQFEALGNVPQRRAVGAPTLGSGSYSDTKAAALKRLSGGPDPYADIASKLGERETGLDNASDKNMWLSLAKGGFDAAAGTSQYALSNIAQGGIGGLDAYNTGETAIQGRRDKLLDSQTDLISKQQDLKFKFQSIADAEAKGELSSIDAENARKIALYGIQNDAESTRYGNEAAIRADKIKMLDMQQRSSESEKDRGNRLSIAKLPGATQRMLDAVVNMKDGPKKDEYKEMINPTSKVLARHKSDMEGLFGEAIKQADITLGDKLTPDDLRRVQLAYMQLPGNDPNYLPLFMAGLGSGAPSAAQSKGRPALTITNKPE